VIRSSIDLGTTPACCWSCGIALIKWLADYSSIVRLGQGVDEQRRLNSEAIERTLACLRDYAAKLRAHGGKPEEALCVSTASARDASNGAEFFERVGRETGFRFQVISGTKKRA